MLHQFWIHCLLIWGIHFFFSLLLRQAEYIIELNLNQREKKSQEKTTQRPSNEKILFFNWAALGTLHFNRTTSNLCCERQVALFFILQTGKKRFLRNCCDSSNRTQTIQMQLVRNSMRIDDDDECVDCRMSMHYGMSGMCARFSSIDWNRMFRKIIEFFGAETHRVARINAFLRHAVHVLSVSETSVCTITIMHKVHISWQRHRHWAYYHHKRYYCR